MKSPPSLAILLACSFAFIIVQLDVTIVNVALPEIGRELQAGVSQLQWVVDAYTLGFAVFLLSAGAMGDRFGSRSVFLGGFTLFTLASLACAVAPDALLLNVARAAQGIGAALLVPSSLSILNAVYAQDRAMLAKAIAWWTAAGGVSIAAGPVLGGLLMSAFGWRSIFWVNIPICVLGFWLTLRVVPALRHSGPARSFDVPGQILAVIALTAFIGAVIEVHALGLAHPAVLAALLVAVVAGAWFIHVERHSAGPMLPLQLFKLAGFAPAVLFGVFVNFAYYGVIFVLSFYLQKVRGFSVLHAGLIFLPLTGTFLFANITSGWLQARVGSRKPMIIGGLIGGSGYALLGLCGISETASFWAMLPGLALIPAGMGLAVPAMTTAILASVDKHQAGTASAVLNTARQVGGAMGVAVYGALVATPSTAAILAGIEAAMAVSTALLLGGALLAYLTIFNQGAKLCHS
ncbi:MFS transporter, DHA2 family, methylenomycin A resistance protein [Duganella sp. CF402]|uniref:MFS transporter n=1 Tax=unclassified Duganella TaxID=2636909 RepID=UPI0008B532AB|nr:MULTISPECIES: MFS transporter [unclassified Duganella]RZT11032.1 DHA2 family methylenomycin A resistance protein-like MFS transporter [Duganella sp. BK701]SEK84790.1 MFS transporter, DHA2 family, methylenomycin A resistance protein [Duganella sp. CF402]